MCWQFASSSVIVGHRFGVSKKHDPMLSSTSLSDVQITLKSPTIPEGAWVSNLVWIPVLALLRTLGINFLILVKERKHKYFHFIFLYSRKNYLNEMLTIIYSERIIISLERIFIIRIVQVVLFRLLHFNAYSSFQNIFFYRVGWSNSFSKLLIAIEP